jgi:hypothetical protein
MLPRQSPTAKTGWMSLGVLNQDGELTTELAELSEALRDAAADARRDLQLCFQVGESLRSGSKWENKRARPFGRTLSHIYQTRVDY